MDVARPRSWRPLIILFSIVLHAVVIYFVAVAFEIVPVPDVPFEPPTIRTVRFDPKPPELPPDTVVKKQPRFKQRVTAPPPVDVAVQPSPLPPVVTPVAQGPAAIDVRQPIPEQPIAQPLPKYPTIAETRGIEGRVVMSITIMPDGSVRDVRVVNAHPRGYFEDAAVRAVQRWRYRPSGVIRTNVIVHMDFELRDA
jgi:protein TonB